MSLLLSAGCRKEDPSPVYLTGPKSDMSAYEYLYDEDHVYYDLTVKEMVEAMEEGNTFVVLFGYAECEWCVEAVPVLNDIAKEFEFQVAYIDTRKDPSWKKNTDLLDYDLLVKTVGEYLEFDSDGIRHLYTPTLFVIKDGAVVATHEGTVEGHNARNRPMKEEEMEELRTIYRELFSLVTEGETDG